MFSGTQEKCVACTKTVYPIEKVQATHSGLFWRRELSIDGNLTTVSGILSFFIFFYWAQQGTVQLNSFYAV